LKRPRAGAVVAFVLYGRPRRIGGSCPFNIRGLLLGGRSTVGHVALDHVIGVRIPASQPTSLAPLTRWLLGTFPGAPSRASRVTSGHESLPPSQLSRKSIMQLWTKPAAIAGCSTKVERSTNWPRPSASPGSRRLWQGLSRRAAGVRCHRLARKELGHLRQEQFRCRVHRHVLLARHHRDPNIR